MGPFFDNLLPSGSMFKQKRGEVLLFIHTHPTSPIPSPEAHFGYELISSGRDFLRAGVFAQGCFLWLEKPSQLRFSLLIPFVMPGKPKTPFLIFHLFKKNVHLSHFSVTQLLVVFFRTPWVPCLDYMPFRLQVGNHQFLKTGSFCFIFISYKTWSSVFIRENLAKREVR